jgi:hypothetical protein
MSFCKYPPRFLEHSLSKMFFSETVYLKIDINTNWGCISLLKSNSLTEPRTQDPQMIIGGLYVIFHIHTKILVTTSLKFTFQRLLFCHCYILAHENANKGGISMVILLKKVLRNYYLILQIKSKIYIKVIHLKYTFQRLLLFYGFVSTYN